MLTYIEVPEVVNSTNTPQRPVRHLTGRYLARTRLSRHRRVALAAALVDGSAEVHPLTLRQAAALTAVSVAAIARARHNGKHNGKLDRNAESLAAHLARSTAAELQAAGRALGVDRVWDMMVLPNIAAERAE